jgi:cation-transporting ATPase 13A1
MQVWLRRERPAPLRHGLPLVAALWLGVACAVVFGVVQGMFAIALLCGLALLATVMLYIMQHWFISLAALLDTEAVADVQRATLVMVRPAPHKGQPGFAKVQHTEVGHFFDYQHRRMLWNAETRAFAKIAYPVKQDFGTLKGCRGVEDEAALHAVSRWGLNSVELRAPSFRELYWEHALAPFFVFQMLFVLLWCLDEYWMYAILTGVMLAFMEAITVGRRLSIVRSLRSMVQKPGRVWVMRNRKWVELDGSEVVPGDLIEVGAAKKLDDVMIPCDAILVAGSCVVNEATLTGENVALLKDNIEQRADAEAYDMKLDRVHTLFGGTRLLQCSNTGTKLRTPNGGVSAVAVRTGFASSQGKVLRTIAFASQAMSANSAEAFLFILFLLSFALVAAGYVLQHGLLDPEKSRFKLLLECIIVLTSVVPPELPIELSLAVNTSLQALRLLRVFCTEPFRIPFAGKLDICAFDKTGTLTRDDLLFRGVVACERGPDASVLLSEAKVSDEALLVVAGCQALSRVEGHLLGDPLEVAALDGLGWQLRGDRDISHNKRKLRVEVLSRYHFSAALRRMTTVVLSTVNTKVAYRVCVKGAPEALRPLLCADDRENPAFDRVYQEYANRGYRVLALASKVIQLDSVAEVHR